MVNENFSAMLRIRLESLHAPEIARATADIMPRLQGIIVKTLTPWAAEQLSVLHEINPDPAQRTLEQEALITDYARDTADAFMMVFQGYMLRSFFGSTEEKDRLYRVALALLPE